MDSPPLNLFFHPMTPLSSICWGVGGGGIFAHSILGCIIFKGGQPANKFRKSKIRKFTKLNNLLDLRTQSFFVICELKLPQVLKYRTCFSSLQIYHMKL